MSTDLDALRALLPAGKLEKTEKCGAALLAINEIEDDVALLVNELTALPAKTAPMRDELAGIAVEALTLLKQADYPAKAAYDEGFNTGAQAAQLEAEDKYEPELAAALAAKEEAERERGQWRYLAEKGAWCVREAFHLIGHHNPSCGSWFASDVYHRWELLWGPLRRGRHGIREEPRP